MKTEVVDVFGVKAIVGQKVGFALAGKGAAGFTKGFIAGIKAKSVEIVYEVSGVDFEGNPMNCQLIVARNSGAYCVSSGA